MPKVSVVIPCYNLGAYLDEAVAAVLAQTFTDFEILVVNDGSTDPDTCRLLADYNMPKTRVIHTENSGVSAARNRGIEEASGEYILPLDADDLIMPDYLRLAVEKLNKFSKVGIVYGVAEYFGEIAEPMMLPDYSPSAILWENSIFSSAVFRKDDRVRAGKYRTEMLKGWEDWDFWLSLVELGGEVVRLPDLVLQYRVRADSRDRSLKLYDKVRLMISMISYHPGAYLRRGLTGVVILFRRRLTIKSNK